MTSALVLLALVGILLVGVASYINGALLPTSAQPYASLVYLGGGVLFALSLVALVIQRARRPDTGVSLYLDDRIRFLTKVHTRYTNRLKPPFAGALLVTLGLSEDAQAVARPALARQEGPGGAPQRLPAGTTITVAFEDAEGQLLILGAPGAGKSWLLYQLALALVERARTDGAMPVPVIFDLASWAQNQKPLDDWMVGQLTETWQVPPAIARVWVDRHQVFPLLDGLDEVRKEAGDACVTAINHYQRAHGLFPLAVCCRKADYDALDARLDLRTAVVAQPLAKEQIDTYLEAGGAPLATLRTMASEERELQQLLSTPLLLSVVALAYADEGAHAASDVIPAPSEDKGAWTRAVFHDYTRRMLQRRRVAPQHGRRQVNYSADETTRDLAWLAAQMRTHGQVDTFYLEQLQPSWLSDDQARRRWRRRVTVFVVLGGELVVGLVVVLGGELVFGLVGGLVFGLGAYIEHQQLVRMLSRLRLIPPYFIDFLDFAADHVLLQRVGGGYRFVHVLLLDYFADQWPDLSATPPKGGE